MQGLKGNYFLYNHFQTKPRLICKYVRVLNALKGKGVWVKPKCSGLQTV